MPEEIDGQGGWWCCHGCGSIAAETFIDDSCVRCGGTRKEFYRSEET